MPSKKSATPTPAKKHKRKMTPAQLANIEKNKAPKWEKGQSGNPAGKPKGTKNRATILRELMELNLKNAEGQDVRHPLDPKKKSIQIEEAVMAALIKKALKGSERAIEMILDSIYGKITENHMIGSDPDAPFQVQQQVDTLTTEQLLAMQKILKGDKK